MTRAPTQLVIDGVMRIGGPRLSAASVPPGYLARPVPGGLEVTAPDGSRLLAAAGPGSVPLRPAGTARHRSAPGSAAPGSAGPYDAAFLDMLGDCAQLGEFRKRGLVTDATMVAAIHVDHRLPSHQELIRRCRLWRIAAVDDGDRVTVPAQHAQPWPPLRRPWRVLLLGGASSGKSSEAELRLAAEPHVTYVAAAGRPDPGDAEWFARVAAHRARRPPWWRTVETTDVAGLLRAAAPDTSAVLIDSIGGWLATVLDECGAWHRPPSDRLAGARLAERTGELAAAWAETSRHVVAVSEETGLGVVPGTGSGRIFRDELGRLNQLLAAQSDEAILLVAGRALPLPG